ncbi:MULTISPECIES: hypothetical protein [Romboutsia]|jgi:accessory gene regulator protein AgrB|uniref:Uncharacterized protein n=2 Tax=Romboutsia ilealis TaxID=1115758 RepID=A0A1V1I195_9FIRM|nr:MULTISPECIES: hypothetical protein [Romboutsia]MCI9061813.1 hypothetical protein [Romboutsia sp.]CED94012.1 Hypothetical protein CRIB_1403 [Romboutsia ilealis]
MREFYMRHRNSIIMFLNIMIISLGVFAKDTKFIIIGILLAALSFYVISLEKKAEEQKAREKAERKALRNAEKFRNRGKKKKKKSKKRK